MPDRAPRAPQQASRRIVSARTFVLCALVALVCGPVVAAVLAGDDRASTATAAAPTGQDLIRAAQRRLGVPADGIAGPATRAAVRAFQEGRGLPVTGQLDDETLVALGVTRQALEVVGTATASGAVSAIRAGEAAVAPEEAAEPAVTTPAPPTATTPTATATTPAATTTTPATTTVPAGAPVDDGEGPAAPVTGGALAGAPPPVVGGQLPNDAGLSPVPPKRPTSRPEIPEQAGLSPTPPVDDAPAGAQLQARLERIARCESGGNPRAISPDGRYRGKYQFTRSTWRSVGGKGDPAAASEAEQDRRAAILYRRTGPSSWPVCGRM